MSTLPITTVDHRASEWSTSGSLGDAFWVQKAAPQLYRRNVPLLHTSTQCPGSLVPRPPHPAFVACSTKSRGKAWTDL